jgi:hypothetical protein
MRKKKPDTDLSAFCVTRSVTPEADLLTCGTASRFLTALGNQMKTAGSYRRQVIIDIDARDQDPDFTNLA